MAHFDYDVMIIGSGFGGSVAALRAAEKGCRWRHGVRPAFEGRRPYTAWLHNRLRAAIFAVGAVSTAILYPRGVPRGRAAGEPAVAPV